MKVESYNAIMMHLDIIEAELNKIVATVGYTGLDDFAEANLTQSERLKTAA